MNTFTKLVIAGAIMSVTTSASAALLTLSKIPFLGPSVTGSIGAIPVVGPLLGGSGQLTNVPFFGPLIASGTLLGIPLGALERGAGGKSGSSAKLSGLDGLKLLKK